MSPAPITPGFFEIIIQLLNLGFAGVILVIWYFDKQTIGVVLNQYRDDSNDFRRMYENNVELVNRYSELAGDLKEIVTLNTQVMTQLVDRIERENR